MNGFVRQEKLEARNNALPDCTCDDASFCAIYQTGLVNCISYTTPVYQKIDTHFQVCTPATCIIENGKATPLHDWRALFWQAASPFLFDKHRYVMTWC
jgi:hypothetical protein